MSPQARNAAMVHALVVLALAVGALVFLAPASGAWLGNRVDVFLGDGTDPAGLLYHYGLLVRLSHTHPTWLVFGGVPAVGLDAPDGVLLFIPFMERLWVVVLGQAMALEHLPVAVAFLEMVFNGVAMWVLARVVMTMWAPGAAALAFCWAFNPYVRARACVHVGLAGTWFLPCVVVGLLLLRRGTRRHTAAAAVAFALAATAAHYYIIMAALLVPVWLLVGRPWSKAQLVRAAVAVAPSAALVAVTLLFPAPEGLVAPAAVVQPDRAVNRAFLDAFGAHPVDYFTSDVKLGHADLNPAKAALNRSVRADIQSNAHERTNGVRWVVWLLCAAWWWQRARGRVQPQDPALALGAAVLCGAGFLLSLSPGALAVGDTALGPSLWVHTLVPQFRVPARFGLVVHFGALLLAGMMLQALHAQRPRVALAACAALLLEYVPLLGVQVEPTMPVRLAAQPSAGPCGRGVHIPYVSNAPPLAQTLAFYTILQTLRGTDCGLVNRQTPDETSRWLTEELGGPTLLGSPEGFSAPRAAQLQTIAACAGLDFLLFAPQVPHAWAQQVCDGLGFALLADNSCRRSAPAVGPWREVAQCRP